MHFQGFHSVHLTEREFIIIISDEWTNWKLIMCMMNFELSNDNDHNYGWIFLLFIIHNKLMCVVCTNVCSVQGKMRKNIENMCDNA